MGILTDTLLGTILEPIHLKAKVKEVSTPKFYFFDCGVVESLSNNLGEPLSNRMGSLLETLILNELRAYSEYSKKHFEIHYWGTPSENEVDFILTKGSQTIGIEVKSGLKWRPEYSKGLDVLLKAKKIQKAFLVYLGKHEELHEKIRMIPVESFLSQLHLGKII